MKIIILLGSLVVLAMQMGCAPKGRTEHSVENISFDTLASVPKVGLPIDMVIKGDTLMISDFFGDSLLHFVKLPECEVLGSKVPRGVGPGELMPPIGVSVWGDTLLAYSRPIMSMFKAGMADKGFLRKIGVAPVMTSNIFTAGNGDLIASVMAYSAEEDNKEYRYALLDDSLQVKYMFGEYPMASSADEIADIDARSHFHQTLMILPVDSKLFIAIGGYDLSFYEIGDNGKYRLSKSVIVSPYDYSVVGGTAGSSASTSLKPGYDRPIIYAALYEGKIILARRREKSPSKDPAILFEVYDMDGNLNTVLIPDKEIIEPFAIDKQGEIIAFSEDEGGFTLHKSRRL